MEPHILIKAHSGIVQLFLLFIIFKIFLLFINKQLLGKVRAKTKIVDMILGVLILVSGFMLLNARAWDIPAWLAVKMILAIASIPVAIIAFKKENKVLAIASVLLMVITYWIGFVVLKGSI